MAAEGDKKASEEAQAPYGRSMMGQTFAFFGGLKDAWPVLAPAIVVMAALGVYGFFHRYGLNAYFILGAEDYVVTAFIGTVADVALLVGNFALIFGLSAVIFLLISAWRLLSGIFNISKGAKKDGWAKDAHVWPWALGIGSVIFVLFIAFWALPRIDSVNRYCEAKWTAFVKPANDLKTEEAGLATAKTAYDAVVAQKLSEDAPAFKSAKQNLETQQQRLDSAKGDVAVASEQTQYYKDAAANGRNWGDEIKRPDVSPSWMADLTNANDNLLILRAPKDKATLGLDPLSDYRNLRYVLWYSILIGVIGCFAALGERGRIVAQLLLAAAVFVGPYIGTLSYLDLASDHNYSVHFKEVPRDPAMLACAGGTANEPGNTLVWSGARTTVLHCPALRRDDARRLDDYTCLTSEDMSSRGDEFVILSNPENRDLLSKSLTQKSGNQRAVNVAGAASAMPRIKKPKNPENANFDKSYIDKNIKGDNPKANVSTALPDGKVPAAIDSQISSAVAAERQKAAEARIVNSVKGEAKKTKSDTVTNHPDPRVPGSSKPEGSPPSSAEPKGTKPTGSITSPITRSEDSASSSASN